MKVSRADLDYKAYQTYQAQQTRLQAQRDEDYRKLVEKRKLDRIDEERIARNRRLERTKGTNIDVYC